MRNHRFPVPESAQDATETPPGYSGNPETLYGDLSGLRVVGLDLSLTATGVAEQRGEVTTIRSRRPGDLRLQELRDRVGIIAAGAQLAVIEDLPTHAHAAGITGMVHGAIRVRLMDLRVPYVTVPPATLKKYATGRGNADKTAMAIALLRRFDLEFRDDNQVDAFWLRAMGLDALGAPLVDLPALHRESLAKVAWPALGGAA